MFATDILSAEVTREFWAYPLWERIEDWMWTRFQTNRDRDAKYRSARLKYYQAREVKRREEARSRSGGAATCGCCGIRFQIDAQRLRKGNTKVCSNVCKGRIKRAFYTVDDETLPIEEWARRAGITTSAITSRIRQGWPIERAVTSSNANRARVKQAETYMEAAE